MARIEIIFLGTGCMVPTPERNHQAIFLKYEDQGILLDCGEGTQRQLKIAGIKPSKVTKIFISHWHGDHVLGLPGLLQSLNASEYEGVLEIYIPKVYKKNYELMLRAFEFDFNMETRLVFFDGDMKIFENSKFILEVMELEHGIRTWGINFIEKDRRKIKIKEVEKAGIPQGPLLGKLQAGEDIVWKGKKYYAKDLTYVIKGKKISYIADTVLNKKCDKLVEDADLLICESAFDSELEEKAIAYKHMTAKQAGLLANRAGVKKLVLTHISQRYKTPEKIIEDAKDVFDNVECSYDFMKIKL